MSDSRDFAVGEHIRYNRFRPRMYTPRMSIFWWVKQKPYVLFIIRELTSLFVAAYAILLILQLNALRRGPEAWESMMAWFATPFSMGFHAVILVFVVFHSITWFRLAPTAMVVRIGGRRLPGSLIIAVNFVMWVALSLAVVWFVLTA
ncbi:MAG: hypothetical protein WD097_05385 [Balneolales bacterium]